MQSVHIISYAEQKSRLTIPSMQCNPICNLRRDTEFVIPIAIRLPDSIFVAIPKDCTLEQVIAAAIKWDPTPGPHSFPVKFDYPIFPLASDLVLGFVIN